VKTLKDKTLRAQPVQRFRPDEPGDWINVIQTPDRAIVVRAPGRWRRERILEVLGKEGR